MARTPYYLYYYQNLAAKLLALRWVYLANILLVVCPVTIITSCSVQPISNSSVILICLSEWKTIPESLSLAVTLLNAVVTLLG